jgi:SPP1 family predicted phage head-tail adaptor
MAGVAELHYYIRLFRPEVIINDEGGREKTFLPEVITKGSVDRLNQARILEAGADALLDTEKVVLRFTKERANITKEWEVEYFGKRATIVEINYTGLHKREWIELLVKEKVNGSTV